jgi:nitric oxide reductase subunit B
VASEAARNVSIERVAHGCYECPPGGETRFASFEDMASSRCHNLFFGLFILGLLAYRTYAGEAPIPGRVVDPSGTVLFTHDDILGGQQVFLRNGLMEYGSIFGHGAYLGPDFTADYLRRAVTSVLDSYGGSQTDRARSLTIQEFKVNRYDPATETLTFTAAQSAAYSQLEKYDHEFFAEPSTRNGLRPNAISDPRDAHQLTAFFGWSAWTGAALRPGKAYS